MPFAYAVYWTVHALIVLWLGQLLAKRFGWSMLKAIVVLAIPVNYAWDFFVEGMAAAMGWWTYDPGIGPVLRFANGGQITLLWTIGLMCFWPNLIAYWAGKPPLRGLNHFERFFALERFTRPKVPAAVPVGIVAQAGARDGGNPWGRHDRQAAGVRRPAELRRHNSALEVRTGPVWSLVRGVPGELLRHVGCSAGRHAVHHRARQRLRPVRRDRR